jgi:hypothetical protein
MIPEKPLVGHLKISAGSFLAPGPRVGHPWARADIIVNCNVLQPLNVLTFAQKYHIIIILIDF